MESKVQYSNHQRLDKTYLNVYRCTASAFNREAINLEMTKVESDAKEFKELLEKNGYKVEGEPSEAWLELAGWFLKVSVSIIVSQKVIDGLDEKKLGIKISYQR